jgi:hypothetical protein
VMNEGNKMQPREGTYNQYFPYLCTLICVERTFGSLFVSASSHWPPKTREMMLHDTPSNVVSNYFPLGQCWLMAACDSLREKQFLNGR